MQIAPSKSILFNKILSFELLQKAITTKEKIIYKLQDKYTFQGLPIDIENKAGSIRKSEPGDVPKWQTKMKLDYGCIRNTLAKDKEAVDVYINKASKGKREDYHTGEMVDTDVYIVHQKQIWKTKDHHNGRCPDCGKHNSECNHNYDEDKVMLGFASKKEAIKAYLKHYDSPMFLGPVSTYTLPQFKKSLKESWGKKIPHKKAKHEHWIGFDLDGTLAKDDGWKGIEYIGDPVPRVKEQILKLLKEGNKVKIFTARASNPKAIPYIKEWMKNKGIPELEITNKKDPGMIRIYDDRAIRVQKNTGKLIKSNVENIYYLDLDKSCMDKNMKAKRIVVNPPKGPIPMSKLKELAEAFGVEIDDNLDKSYLGQSGDIHGSTAMLRENIVKKNPKAIVIEKGCMKKMMTGQQGMMDGKVSDTIRIITDSDLQDMIDDAYEKYKFPNETKHEYIQRSEKEKLAKQTQMITGYMQKSIIVPRSEFQKGFVKQHTRKGKVIASYFTKRKKKIGDVRHKTLHRLDMSGKEAKDKIALLEKRKQFHDAHIEAAKKIKEKVESHKAKGNEHYEMHGRKYMVNEMITHLSDHVKAHENEKQTHDNHIKKISKRYETEAKHWEKKGEKAEGKKKPDKEENNKWATEKNIKHFTRNLEKVKQHWSGDSKLSLRGVSDGPSYIKHAQAQLDAVKNGKNPFEVKIKEEKTESPKKSRSESMLGNKNALKFGTQEEYMSWYRKQPQEIQGEGGHLLKREGGKLVVTLTGEAKTEPKKELKSGEKGYADKFSNELKTKIKDEPETVESLEKQNKVLAEKMEKLYNDPAFSSGKVTKEGEKIKDQWRSLQSESTEIKKKIRNIRTLKPVGDGKTQAARDMEEKRAIKEANVTSTTYERAKTKTGKDVDAFLSGKGKNTVIVSKKPIPKKAIVVKKEEIEKPSYKDKWKVLSKDEIKSKYPYGKKQAEIGHSTKDAAKRIREDIKDAVKSGVLPEGLKISVRKGSGAYGLNIDIKAVPEGMTAVNPYNVKYYEEGFYGSDVYNFKEHPANSGAKEIDKIINILTSMANQYNYDRSDAMTDYFDFNFHPTVGLDWEFSAKERDKIKEELKQGKHNDVEFHKDGAFTDNRDKTKKIESGKSKSESMVGNKNAYKGGPKIEPKKIKSKKWKPLSESEITLKYPFGHKQKEIDLDTKAAAKRIRTDIKEAIKKGDLPEGTNVSVKMQRYSMGSSIDLTVTSLPDDTMIMNPYRVKYEHENPHESAANLENDHKALLIHSKEGRSIKNTLEAIKDQYNYGKGQKNKNFYGGAGFDYKLENEDRDRIKKQVAGGGYSDIDEPEKVKEKKVELPETKMVDGREYYKEKDTGMWLTKTSQGSMTPEAFLNHTWKLAYGLAMDKKYLAPKAIEAGQKWLNNLKGRTVKDEGLIKVVEQSIDELKEMLPKGKPELKLVPKKSVVVSKEEMDYSKVKVGREDYQERKESRIDRLENKAEKAEQESSDRHKSARDIADRIPFGQPILVGHHSEKRARRDQGKIHSNMSRAVDAGKKADEYKDKAEAAKSNRAISSDDPEAVVKLKEKLDGLKVRQETMKKVNAAWRKFKKNPDSLDKTDLTDNQKDTIRLFNPKYSWDKGPYAGYELTNNNANIRNTKQRLDGMVARSGAETKTIYEKGDVKIIDNVESNRIQVKFPGKPDEKTRKILKSNGFRWAPSENAWQRKRSANTNFTVKHILIKELESMSKSFISKKSIIRKSI